MARTAPTRTGSWLLDPARTVVAFSGRAAAFAPTFRASFASVSGSVHLGDVAQLAVDVDVRSLTTGNRSWDELLHRLDPFDASSCPRATYRGTADLSVGDRVHIDGSLELRGVLQPVALVAQVRGRGDEVVVRASGSVDRRAFGVRCDLPGAGRFVPSVMRLDVEATAVHVGRIPTQR